ncbi:hypothetical protein LJC32_03670 [Oscillospiraceae bacterium OttesenSCG-928-F05]|nr:hypothetical protein [Oscillospiraceae bacterium OttesenSCG-928-F05]
MKLKELIFGGTTGTEKKNKTPDSTEALLPFSDIRHGMVITADGRFVKILEVLPINFYLKTRAEQSSIIYYFASWLKVAPASLQITTVTQKSDIGAYVRHMRDLLQNEQNERCRAMIEDNIAEIEYLADREAVTRRFFISFQHEPGMKTRDGSVEAVAEQLSEEADTARRFLDMCGLEVVEPRYQDNALAELLYELTNKKTSREQKLPETVFTMTGLVHGVDMEG